MFSRFDPAEVRLTGNVIKTRGRMTFEAGKSHTVVVHADYTFVYPLVHADKGATEVARTIVRRVLDIELYDPAKYQVTPGKFNVSRYDSTFGNSDCDVNDGYFHPHFNSDTATTGADPTGPTIDPYDRRDEGAAEIGDGECGIVTRS